MRLHTSFRIDRRVEEVLDAVLDLATVAGCVPGARNVRTVGDGSVEGELGLKIGPLAARYAGSAQLREIQREEKTFALRARGRELSGMGAADALVRVRLSALDGSTRVDLDTDLSIRGKVAQHGRGTLGEVAERMTGQVAENLERMLEERVSQPMPAADTAAVPVGTPTGTEVARASSVSRAAAAVRWLVVAVPVAAAAAYAGARLAARRR